ncbi:hypothetical protein [Streptacidiphilus anmyonensis]|uniref:hypothetical protein n=1 Tax=Streptacidiphilus anmyonensis TaxID=405782 RepID=UPI0005A6CDD6|nr:hypothetical protein [Streptacidiphilus anmyonensis]
MPSISITLRANDGQSFVLSVPDAITVGELSNKKSITVSAVIRTGESRQPTDGSLLQNGDVVLVDDLPTDRSDIESDDSDTDSGEESETESD